MRKVLISCLSVLLLCACSSAKEEAPVIEEEVIEEPVEEVEDIEPVEVETFEYTGISEFDLAFVKMENAESDLVYSPLSIKYALSMLKDGAEGNTKEQIEQVMGDYVPRKYKSNDNMSLANALFVKDGMDVKEAYKRLVKEKYDGDVMNDSLESPDNVNDYISNKTFGMITDYYDDISDLDFILMNTLALDMEWVNPIQGYLYLPFEHEKCQMEIFEFELVIGKAGFNHGRAVVAEFGGAFNKYDIVGDLGEDNIRKTVKEAYDEWVSRGGYELDIDEYLNDYISQIDSNYNTGDVNTDFSYYVDDEVKVFAKDLKEYNGTTLQYMAIMPINQSLESYINQVTSEDIEVLIDSLMEPSLENVEEGYVTKFIGYAPIFSYDYKLNLKEDLMSLGIKDAFNPETADLSNIYDSAYVDSCGHKAVIDFSNEGIKAAAITELGIGAMGGMMFEYDFDVPVKVIDLSFDNPFLYLIRDKATGEVWFVGTLYETDENIAGIHEYY